MITIDRTRKQVIIRKGRHIETHSLQDGWVKYYSNCTICGNPLPDVVLSLALQHHQKNDMLT